MSEKHKALRDALAAGPTDGPWKVGKELSARSCDWLISLDAGDMGRGIAVAETRAGSGKELHNARFIAAANPETIRALLAERDQLLQACETALSYVEAVCFNTPNEKKRRNYADCAAKIRAAMGEDEGEPHD